MRCLKCGREVPAGQDFCDSCLTDMERHPVKPGTPVIIPKRDKPLPSKRNYKRIQKPEDMIVAQRKLIGWLLTTIILLLLAIGALTVAMFYYKQQIPQKSVLETVSDTQIVSRETIFDTF